MNKTRLEAFSDGVIAIIITIMVLELKVPHGDDLHALQPLLPVFICYILSFAHLGIYWNNHHHLVHAAKHVSGRVLWANLHLLFWLSLVPFTTSWLGENHLAAVPMAVYAFVLFMAGTAWEILRRSLIAADGKESQLMKVVGVVDQKGRLSWFLYLASIPLAFVSPWITALIIVFVALMWLIPDRRIERAFKP